MNLGNASGYTVCQPTTADNGCGQPWATCRSMYIIMMGNGMPTQCRGEYLFALRLVGAPRSL